MDLFSPYRVSYICKVFCILILYQEAYLWTLQIGLGGFAHNAEKNCWNGFKVIAAGGEDDFQNTITAMTGRNRVVFGQILEDAKKCLLSDRIRGYCNKHLNAY